MITQWLNEKLNINTTDPDDQRRGKLLNILLLSMFILAAFALLSTLLFTLLGLPFAVEPRATIIPATGMLLTAVIIFFINRSVSSVGAGILFLAFFVLIVWLSDQPYELVWGRSMIMFVVPIIIASVILRPVSSFIVAFFLAFLLVVSANTNDIPINYVGILVYLMIALISWLSATTLEKALHELREINKELDEKVEERTSELMIANTQLAEARDAALEASQYKTELTARVSHELLTPLDGIMGFAEMLLEGYFGPVNEKQKSKLTAIIETTKNLSDLVGDWLDQAKLESGKLELYNYWFAVREATAYVEDITKALLKEKPIDLIIKVDTAVPHLLYGDEDRILQIMINLVSNAIKYTEKGSVHASVYMQEPNWIFTVHDTGIGIAAKSLPTIFTSFSQIDDSRARTHKGFGLGLSIVKQIVDLMNGEIQVESKVGEGTLFRVILPIISDGKDPNETASLEEEIG